MLPLRRFSGVCPWPDLSSLFQYTSPTRVVSLHLIPRIQYHPGIPVTLLTGSSSYLIFPPNLPQDFDDAARNSPICHEDFPPLIIHILRCMVIFKLNFIFKFLVNYEVLNGVNR